MPGFLIDSFGTTPYLTQEFNNWLLGWHDPVVAFLATGNPMDMTVGWTSLESNATYYGSGGIVSDTGTDYMICTGEVSTCDKGEMMAVDGSSYFAWKDPAKTVNTLGLITAESRTGTTGGFLTGSGDMVDLSGYATAAITCDGTSTLKDIAVDDCSASLNPLERPIQAKLLDTDTLLDTEAKTSDCTNQEKRCKVIGRDVEVCPVGQCLLVRSDTRSKVLSICISNF